MSEGPEELRGTEGCRGGEGRLRQGRRARQGQAQLTQVKELGLLLS